MQDRIRLDAFDASDASQATAFGQHAHGFQDIAPRGPQMIEEARSRLTEGLAASDAIIAAFFVTVDFNSRVSGSSETKTYGKSAMVRDSEEQATFPRRPFFGKDGDERSRVFNALHVLVSPAYALFSGKMSYTAIARRGRASS